MNLGELLFFACAVSVDALGAGLLYSWRQIKVPFGSHLCFLLSSIIVTSFSVICGQMLGHYFLGHWGKYIGGALLFLMGIWWCLRDYKEKRECGEAVAELRQSSNKQKPAAFISLIMDNPVCADLDTSGTISIQEAMILGFALSVDALAAGIGAVLAGLDPIWIIFLVGFFQQLFIILGLTLGRYSFLSKLKDKGTLLAGSVLCLLGLSKILF